MQTIKNASLTHTSRSLRKNMTEQERKLWYLFLKKLPIQFYRQKVFNRYILDFYCPSKKLVIEIDGSQHFADDLQINKDENRDLFLNKHGLTVLRFSNRQIEQEFKNVCEDILKHLE